MITEDAIKYLRGSSAVMAEVDGRIYGEVAPQSASFPYITISETDNTPEYTLQGESGKSRALLQVDGWCRDDKGGVQARRLEALIRNRMSGYRGAFGDTFADCVVMRRNTLIDEPPTDASGRYIRRCSMDFAIVHTQAVPDFT